MIKPSFILKGALTYVLPRWAYARKSGGSGSARYCYSVFMRHLVRLNSTGVFRVPVTVAELGPGDSIGIGLCALLSGAERYIGLDVVHFADLSGNLAVFDELVSLFQERASIPDDNEFPRIKPKLDNYAFPEEILGAEVLAKALAPDRLAALRRDLQTGGGKRIEYAAPWYESERIDRNSVGWVFSQAVLEHVDDLDGAYEAFTAWLAPDGVMSHQIDFKCHNMATEWNGHWATPNWLWRIVRGRRPYLLNREPITTHLEIMARHGFDVVDIERVSRADGISPDQLPRRYRILSGEDLATAGAFIVSRRHSPR